MVMAGHACLIWHHGEIVHLSEYIYICQNIFPHKLRHVKKVVACTVTAFVLRRFHLGLGGRHLVQYSFMRDERVELQFYGVEV